MCDNVKLSPVPVACILSSLNDSSVAGPESLHPRMLKVRSNTLSFSLYLLFGCPLSEGLLQTLWKTSIVTPLFKSGY